MKIHRLYYLHEGKEIVIEKSTDKEYLENIRAQMKTGYLGQFVYLHLD